MREICFIHFLEGNVIESSFVLLKALKQRDLLKDKPSWWWHNHGSFEVILGAILVQNTQWQNVEKMLTSLKGAGLIGGDSQKDLESMAHIQALVLQSHIRGLQKQKSSSIIKLSQAILRDFGSFEYFRDNVDFEWLLAQKGIGRESAYAILNYACGREVMVVDKYTYKLLCALGWEIEDYEELRAFCESGVRENMGLVYEMYPQDMPLAQIFARFHGKIVEFSKLKLSPQELLV